MIDGGSTHNFIDRAIVAKFRLDVDSNRRFSVQVANKKRVNCDGICQGVEIDIHRTKVTKDFYVLPAAVCPMVLVVQ